MGKFLSLFSIFIIFFSSCAPLKKHQCEQQFLSILKKSHKKQSIHKIRGSIYVKGILLLFNGSFDKNTSITLFTPIGTPVAKFYEGKDKVCIVLKGNKICGNVSDMYKQVLSEEIPFSLTDIIQGRFNISPESKYSCDNGNLFVQDRERSYVFKRNLLKSLKYKDFLLEYEYERDIPKKVTLKYRDTTLAKIFIRDIE